MDQFNPFNQTNPQLNTMQNQFMQLQNLYNQLTNQPKFQALSQPVQNAPSILWVDGIEGAKAYQMQPNTTAALFDKNDSVFYFRSLDANGVEAPIKVGRFTLEDAPEPESNVLTKKDLDDFREEVRQMLRQIPRDNRNTQNNQNNQNNHNNQQKNQEGNK